uniref:PINc domain-containing protein n=1 Tax=Macrostomum lignano TaxID=282301 RepID=A0A1I8FJ92_9PLAT
MDCLYGKCVLYVTDCVLAEMEKMGEKYRGGLEDSARSPVRRLSCLHKGTYADELSGSAASPITKFYIVATCDRDLRRRLRRVPGVRPSCTCTPGGSRSRRMPDALVLRELLDDLPCLNLPVPLLGLSKAADAAATAALAIGELLRRLPGRRSRQSSGDACAAAAKLMADEPPPWWMRDIGATGPRDARRLRCLRKILGVRKRLPRVRAEAKGQGRARGQGQAGGQGRAGGQGQSECQGRAGVKAEDKENSGNNRRLLQHQIVAASAERATIWAVSRHISPPPLSLVSCLGRHKAQRSQRDSLHQAEAGGRMRQAAGLGQRGRRSVAIDTQAVGRLVCQQDGAPVDAEAAPSGELASGFWQIP